MVYDFLMSKRSDGVIGLHIAILKDSSESGESLVNYCLDLLILIILTIL